MVSYTLIPPEGGRNEPDGDGRVEPRLTVVPVGRKPMIDEIAAPTASEVAEHAGGSFRPEAIEPLPPDIDTPPRRRRGFPRVALIGLFALLVGFGILAATFAKVMTGNVVATAPVEAPAVALAPAPAEESAGPGVRAILPSGDSVAAPEATVPATDTPPADVAATTPVTNAPPTVAPADTPLPRLRPTMYGGSAAALPPPSTATATAEPLPQPAAIAPATTAQPSDEVGTLMADVDRLLAEHKTAAPPAAAPVPLAGGTNVARLGGAAIALGNPGLPPPSGVPQDDDTDGVVLFPEGQQLPVPPADIPNGGF